MPDETPVIPSPSEGGAPVFAGSQTTSINEAPPESTAPQEPAATEIPPVDFSSFLNKKAGIEDAPKAPVKPEEPKPEDTVTPTEPKVEVKPAEPTQPVAPAVRLTAQQK